MSRKRIITMSAALTLCLGAAALEGQEATERYIPVGQSPGLSGVSTYMGSIAAVDQQSRTITVQAEGGESRSIALTPGTHVWLDLSRLGRSNTNGSVSDLQAGRMVEVKYEDDQRRERAYWIKVVIEGN